LPATDDEESPPFKYADDRTPYAPQGREILRLIRNKASDEEIQEQMNIIQEAASERGVTDPLVPSTDVYMTCVCFAGSKSLSHILSYIERCKTRLLSIGSSSAAARRQIVDSVMQYWAEKPGIGINIVDKLLNYTILTPLSVVEWALVDKLERGKILTAAHIYEMIASTTYKVTNRVRQIVTARSQPGLAVEQVKMLEDTLEKERASMVDLFTVIEDALRGIAEGSADAMAESQDQDEEGESLLRAWGRRWLRVFRRKMAVEQAWIQEMLATPAQASPNGNGNVGE
jgi:nuclear cap-binding protein subunit 1